jgi:hypothetical protein
VILKNCVDMQAEKLDEMLDNRKQPLDAVVEFTIGRGKFISCVLSGIKVPTVLL